MQICEELNKGMTRKYWGNDGRKQSEEKEEMKSRNVWDESAMVDGIGEGFAQHNEWGYGQFGLDLGMDVPPSGELFIPAMY